MYEVFLQTGSDDEPVEQQTEPEEPAVGLQTGSDEPFQLQAEPSVSYHFNEAAFVSTKQISYRRHDDHDKGPPAEFLLKLVKNRELKRHKSTDDDPDYEPTNKKSRVA